MKISESKRESGISAGGFQSNISCMPAFRADTDDYHELDTYIERFERHTTLSKWPQDLLGGCTGQFAYWPRPRCLCVDVTSVQDASDFDLLKRML